MRSTPLRLAITLVRLWTKRYTSGVPPAIGDRRREEIESDLWEFEHDPDRGGEMASAFRVLARWLLGVPDDVLWKLNQRTLRPLAVRVAVALATLAVVAIVLVGQALRPPTLPTVTPAPPPDILTLHKRTPPVAPPPPPPPPIAGQKHQPDWASLLLPRAKLR